MYAQLCKRLSEEAPNWEPANQPCTFRFLLLNRCRTEFENRASALEEFEGEKLRPEDEEKRYIAKSKMLGNIKFIGELTKLEILSGGIVHRCIQQLLHRRSAEAADHHEDLECLAQLLRTCGRMLDSERGRLLVDQYFARIDTLSTNRDLAPRIRFMLCDLVELRRNGWIPRAAITTEGPVPIQQLGSDDDPPSRASQPDPLFRHGLRTRSGLDDMLSGLSLTSNNLVPPPNSDKFGFGSNGFGGRDYRHRNQGYGYNQRNQGSFNKHHHNNSSNNNSKETAPRFSKGRIMSTPGAVEELRPAANSLLFTANKLIKPHVTALPLTNTSNVLTPAFASVPLLKESAITIKSAADKQTKPKKDKGLNKEEILKTVMEICSEACAECGTPNEEEIAGEEEPKKLSPYLERLRALQLNDKMLRQACNALLQRALLPESSIWVCVWLVRGVKRGSLSDNVKALVSSQHARLPSLLAHCILQKLCTLKDTGSWLEGEQGSTLLLQVLQELLLLVGQDTLTHMYNESKLELSCAGAALAEAVEARGLGFLVPQLRVRAELARQLAREPAVQPLYRWIKTNVEPALRHSPAFVSTLFSLILNYIIQEAGTECVSPDKASLEKEKSLVEQYAPLLTAALDARPPLQLTAVYAVQVSAHNYNYPKGMLLRWFMYLYNLEVCEEEAFLQWREDVTDAYPAKGEALFQVNAWLTWLQQQESEDEEADD